MIQIRKRRTIQSRAERKTSLRWEEGERERESRDYLHAFLWYNTWLNHYCASSCKCMCTYLIQRVCKECVCLSCSRFLSGAEQYRKAGWLAGCTGKETVSIKQQMEDSMCLHCRNTHISTDMHTHVALHTQGIMCENSSFY